MTSISIDELVGAIGQQTQKVNPLLWVIAEPSCKSKFAPHYLALNVQLKPEDKLEINAKIDRMKINGRELSSPAGITYSITLVKPDQNPQIVYTCSIDLVGAIKETGSELLYR